MRIQVGMSDGNRNRAFTIAEVLVSLLIISIGAAALIGTPLITSGSFSKDEIIEAALETQPVIGWLLIGAALLTGLYIGRLFFVVYQSPAADPHAVHHEPAPERDMNWALVPLMIGAISFGWLGGWLMQHLSGTIPVPEQPPPLISPAGLLAFALGVIGVAFAWWLSQPGQRAAPVPAETSYRPDRWVSALASLGYAASAAVSRVQSGLLARYAFGSFLAVAVVLLLRVTVR